MENLSRISSSRRFIKICFLFTYYRWKLVKKYLLVKKLFGSFFESQRNTSSKNYKKIYSSDDTKESQILLLCIMKWKVMNLFLKCWLLSTNFEKLEPTATQNPLKVELSVSHVELFSCSSVTLDRQLFTTLLKEQLKCFLQVSLTNLTPPTVFQVLKVNLSQR